MGVDADYEVEWNYLTDTLIYEYGDVIVPDSLDFYVFGQIGASYSSYDCVDAENYIECLQDFLNAVEDNCSGVEYSENCGNTFNQCCDTIDSHIGSMIIDSTLHEFGFYAADTIYNDGTNDQPNTNPDHWASPHGLMSLETSKGTSFRDKNYVEVTPGFKPTNVTNPEMEDGDDPFNELITFGNGGKFYTIINEESHSFEIDNGINDNIYKYVVNADPLPTSYQNLDLANPQIFVYEAEYSEGEYVAKELDEQTLFMYELEFDTTIFSVDSILIDTSVVMEGNEYIYADTSNLGFPGVDIISRDETSGKVVFLEPIYSLQKYGIGYESDDDFESNWSNFHNGIMVRFDNPPEQVRTFNSANKIKYVEYDLSGSGDTSCIELSIQAKDYPDNDIQKYYNFEIVFGEPSVAYKGGAASNYNFYVPDAVSKCHKLITDDCEAESGCEWDADDNYCYEPNFGLGRCFDQLVPYEWEYPFSIYNLETGNKVYLGPSSNTYDHDNDPDTTPIVFTNYVRGLNIRFLESEVTDSTYYFHSHEAQGEVDACSDFLYMTFELELDLLELPPSDINCPYDPCCVSNSNQIQYPWEYNNSDNIKITMKKAFIDGDSWILDMSQFGRATSIEETDLEKIKVVPNPYIVASGMDETKQSKRMAFTKLPEKCTIKIYTITGEHIRTLEHYDTFNSSEFWDLRTENNQEIAPGLYIYTIEAYGKKHISKFAVVR